MDITTPADPTLRRLTAFTDDRDGGNPAGVWLGETLPSPDAMLETVAAVGYSETAFLAPAGDGAYHVRYFSPEAEVSFCGHATIAAGVRLGRLLVPGTYRFHTSVGTIPVVVTARDDGRLVASLTSVTPEQADPDAALLTGALDALGWRPEELDPAIAPRLAWAGAWHLVLAVADRQTLDDLDYDYAALKRLMLDADLTTLQLVWREDERTFHARNPFPVGGVVEDPATGASAAALGGYLRDAGILTPPTTFVVHQGVVMGRPSRIEVDVPAEGGITVTGTAVDLDTEPLDRVAAAERLARSFLDRVWRAPADLAAIDELMTEDYVITSAGTVVRGREQFKTWVRRFQESLSHATNEVVDVFADPAGERVVARWICRGTNRGIFDLPPDGRPLEFTGIAVWGIRDGRLAECWVERSGLEAVRAHGGAS